MFPSRRPDFGRTLASFPNAGNPGLRWLHLIGIRRAFVVNAQSSSANLSDSLPANPLAKLAC